VKFDAASLAANQRLAHYQERLSQGLPISENIHNLHEWLRLQAKQEAHPLLSKHLEIERAIYFDLSHPDGRNPKQTESFNADIIQLLRQNNSNVGIGRYNENRHCYQSDIFQQPDQARTLPIGVDIFVPPSTSLYSPLPAKVHSWANNNNLLDYGPTIILQHQFGKNLSFYSLYGHLSLDSLTGLYPGKLIPSGELFATVGSYPDNGNWPPHVHVQLIADMLDFEGDFPGVVRAEDNSVWLQLCPNPNLLFTLPKETPANTKCLTGV